MTTRTGAGPAEKEEALMYDHNAEFSRGYGVQYGCKQAVCCRVTALSGGCNS